MLFVYRVVFFFEKMIMAFHRFRHLRFFKKAKMILRGNCGIQNLRIADQDYKSLNTQCLYLKALIEIQYQGQEIC